MLSTYKAQERHFLSLPLSLSLTCTQTNTHTHTHTHTGTETVEDCLKCPRYANTADVASQQFESCICPDGSTVSQDQLRCECEAGKYMTADSVCESCPSGRYSGVIGIESVQECENCPTYFDPNTPGITDVTQCVCPARSSAVESNYESCQCDVGYYMEQNECVECPQGRYGTHIGNVRLRECLVCPRFSFTNVQDFLSQMRQEANSSNHVCVLLEAQFQRIKHDVNVKLETTWIWLPKNVSCVMWDVSIQWWAQSPMRTVQCVPSSPQQLRQVRRRWNSVSVPQNLFETQMARNVNVYQVRWSVDVVALSLSLCMSVYFRPRSHTHNRFLYASGRSGRT